MASGTLILVLAIIFSFPYGKNLFLRSDKINFLLSGKYEKFREAGSLGKKLYAWPIYLKAALKHPFKGTGLARRVQKKVLWEVEAKTRLEHAHNLFLNLWLQAGIQTSLIFLVFYIYLFKVAQKTAKSCYNKADFFFFAVILVFLIAFGVAAFFEGHEKSTRFVPFWLAAGMLMGHKRYLEIQGKI